MVAGLGIRTIAALDLEWLIDSFKDDVAVRYVGYAARPVWILEGGGRGREDRVRAKQSQ